MPDLTVKEPVTPAAAPVEPAAPAQPEVVEDKELNRLASANKGMAQQLREFQEKERAWTATQDAEKEAKLIADGNLNDLLVDTKDKLTKSQLENRDLRFDIEAKDVNGSFNLKGLKSTYKELGDDAPPIKDWLDTMRVSNPDLFAASTVVSTTNAAPGMSTQTSGSTLTDETAEALTKSEDPKDRQRGRDYFEAKLRGG